MNSASLCKILVIAVMWLGTGLKAKEIDVSGGWVNERGQPSTLVQVGSRVMEVSSDPQFIAFFGEHSFIGSLKGTSLRGKVATMLEPEVREFCGNNKGTWVDFEMELSTGGNRMEGRWKRNTQITTQAGCPIQSVAWEPYVLTRTDPNQQSLSTKRYIIGGLSLLGLALVIFFIRGAFENYLVGSMKRAPNTASLASWSLFGGLLSASAIGSTPLIGGTYMVLPVIIPLAVLSMLCLVMCVVFSNNK